MNIKLPNFLIVGAAKSGTSSLYHYLKQHPEIYMIRGNKEPCFFVASIYKQLNPEDPRYKQLRKFLVFTFEDYADLCRDVDEEKCVGEASVPYLYYYEEAIDQIKKYIGDVKIIIIIRNPVERAISAHNFLLRNCAVTQTFEECLETENEKIAMNWEIMHFYKDVGFYSKQIDAYKKHFSQVKVVLFDDLVKGSLDLLKELFSFLDINTLFKADVQEIHNPSGVPTNRLVNYFLATQNPLKTIAKPIIKPFCFKKNNFFANLKRKNLKKIEIRPETHKYLKNLYKDDIEKLQLLINRDLSHWLM